MDNNKGKQVVLKKIPIAVLLDALEQIYLSGIDYIDIIGDHGVEQDTITLKYRSDYIVSIENEDEESPEEDKTIEEHSKDIDLSDDDINKLI